VASPEKTSNVQINKSTAPTQEVKPKKLKEPETKLNTSEEIEMESLVDGTKNLKFQNEEIEPPESISPSSQNSQKELNPVESKNVEKSFISQTKTPPRFQKPKLSFPKVDLKRSSPPQRPPVVEKKPSAPIQKIETKKSSPPPTKIQENNEPKRMREEDFSIQQNSEKRRKIDFDDSQIEEVNSLISIMN
jgi:hypothetical protein